MSFAAQTWTMDTANEKWYFSNGDSTELADNAQTLSFTATDTGDGGIYFGAPASSFTLLNGDTVTFEGDPKLTFFRSEADGQTYDCGSVWVYVNGGKREELKITTMTVTDGDAVGANNLASITFEYPGTPYSWTWTNINTA